MNLTSNVKETFTSLLENMGVAVWIEITTQSPQCTYFFGPFVSVSEAEQEKSGYIEDLEAEGAFGISIDIKRCNPDKLTVFDETKEMLPGINTFLSRQPG
ncbi:protein of unknown function DUF1816 [Thalassoporum mexicanum PCC 7367]|uniref:DUF1816 domain-containing protein n=1 Tax=Thalassoporum mexicanum TaxID=3457544 RepID=UPI00029F8EF5|nr:DUF1816 domain-containing protein [Pseudanabaena sp. PCC 7367]AFY71107.1 protein of unknown function DUF1816 [Pseudanabaena sp. PCC 7367]